MKIIWLKTELLHPVDKGGKIRTYNMLRELKKDHHITYLTLDDGLAENSVYDNAFEYADDLITIPHRTSKRFSIGFYTELMCNLFSSMPYALQKYVSAEMQEKITSLTEKKNFDILICDFLAPAVNLPLFNNVPTLLFQHNVEAMIWRRHFEIAENLFKKPYFKLQWKRMMACERKLCRRFDHIVAVSKEDAGTMEAGYGVQSISYVGTGVDTNYFSNDQPSSATGQEIVFTGSMDWLPNDDAVRWFLKEIFPLIREKVPDASFSIVGRNPSSAVVEYGFAGPEVAVTGRVPDVRPYMKSAKVYVVPIRIGGGTRLKIFEAMAMGLPVVSTRVGAEGLPLDDGNGILLKDDAQDFADAVVALLNDERLARDMGQAGADVVRSRYSWDKIIYDFNKACSKAVERFQPPGRS